MLKVSELQDILTTAAKFHHNTAQDEFNDYRAEKAVTEYLMTADFARSILRGENKVGVEVQCKKIVNHINSCDLKAKHKALGKKRFDIVIGDTLLPYAILEIKIGVNTALKIIGDADKIIDVLHLTNKRTHTAYGVLVFETFVDGRHCVSVADFQNAYAPILAFINKELTDHIQLNWPYVTVSVHKASESIAPAEIDQTLTIDRDGGGSFIGFAIVEVPPMCSRIPQVRATL